MKIKLENGSSIEVSQDWIDEQLCNGTFDSIIEVICLGCGEYYQLEPDGQRVNCDNCDKVVRVFNPLMAAGMI